MIEVAQQLLASGSGKLLGRNEIAEAANVTPALVSYYFRDQASLIEAVTAPVIGTYITELKGVLRSSAGSQARLRDLIRLFLRFNRDYAIYLDGFLTVCVEDKAKQIYKAAVLEAYEELVEHFAAGMREGLWRPTNPAFLVFALWGVCKFVAQGPLLPIDMFEGPRIGSDPIEAQVSLILDLFSHGALQDQNNLQ